MDCWRLETGNAIGCRARPASGFRRHMTALSPEAPSAGSIPADPGKKLRADRELPVASPSFCLCTTLDVQQTRVIPTARILQFIRRLAIPGSDESLRIDMNSSLLLKAAAPVRVLAGSHLTSSRHTAGECLRQGARIHTVTLRVKSRHGAAGRQCRSSVRVW